MGSTHCTFLLAVTVRVWAASTGQKDTCPEYYFWDHGTEHCENCGDICDKKKSEHMGTLDQCWELCKPYALILWPPKPVGTPAPISAGASTDLKVTSELPTGAVIAITIIPVIAIAGLCILLTVKRKAIVRKFRGGTPDPDPQRYQTATLLNPRPEQEHLNDVGTHGGSSVQATAGTQEEGPVSGPTTEGNYSWHILEMDSLHGPKSPVQVSTDGHFSPGAMALLPFRLDQQSFITNNTAVPSAPPDDEYHSTEPKTLQSSMDDSTQGAVGGMSETRL